MIKVENKISVCVDCINFIANGELPADTTESQDKAWVDKINANWPPGEQQLVDADEHAGFETTPCDCCDSPLHGDRFSVLILKKV
ncbi:MAG: hypothetical protein DRQ89_11665 [Epsilonproteobacteria bacterium]|nr:MAG: hypothetical protein DRQ89_11665 [Campylobacterota bacterium]